MKIGAITVGQSPRTDVTADIMGIFDGKAELCEKGGLDGLTKEEISEFKPEEGDYILVSRLNDGSSVTFAERFILPRLETAIHELEKEGAELIMMFCTGKFPDTLKSSIPLIYPCDILDRMVPLFSTNSSIIVVTPSPEQLKQSMDKWSQIVTDVKVISASPYGDRKEILKAAEQAKGLKGDVIVLDCIGYSQEMKEIFARETKKPVILPRTLLARMISELTDR
ncbi:AroM family protein [Clostridium boliviensis]|uniref:AroM family protein n=1 Tax=Clostridium boliviensis TaxID=318465 RepID=A0ABU4GQP3_9CLOT|nr:AroM family protein [Clostridium boliviensis]MDW2799949.1 AroM family protein [Clostridium boliviensis]